MSKYTHDKNYIYYEGSNIPINKLNLRDDKTLEKTERKLLLQGYEYFHKRLSETTVFDERYFRELHKITFHKLYDFAGKHRTVNISKGYSTFCQVRFLEQTSKRIFTKLQNDNYLKNFSEKPKEEFAQKIAYYMCELIALHPFFELNGRITRLFFDMIATYNGYDYINYKNTLTDIKNGENKFIKASIECMIGNENEMFQIILNGLKKAE